MIYAYTSYAINSLQLIMPRGKKQFALIWWLKTGQKDVISLSTIPKCKQKLNSIVNLTWQNFETNKQTKAEARILAISDDENELHKTLVTDTGNIHEPTKKIFSANVLHETKTMKKKKKLIENIKRSNKKQLEEKISKYHTIYKENCSPSKNISQNITQPTILHNLETTNTFLHNQEHIKPVESSIISNYQQSSNTNNFMESVSSGVICKPMSHISYTQNTCNKSENYIVTPSCSTTNFVSQCVSNQLSTSNTSNGEKLISRLFSLSAKMYQSAINV